jgi:hypothetical protein
LAGYTLAGRPLVDAVILMDPARLVSFRHFKLTAHCMSTLVGTAGTAELLAFGQSIGLKDTWLQKRGDPQEHFDLFDAAILRAKLAGAEVVPPVELIRRCVHPKRGQPAP